RVKARKHHCPLLITLSVQVNNFKSISAKASLYDWLFYAANFILKVFLSRAYVKSNAEKNTCPLPPLF
ncbi:hypothetical protein, partial [Acinetobacter entericus]